jgi:hypothetical protein
LEDLGSEWNIIFPGVPQNFYEKQKEIFHKLREIDT